MASDPRSCHPPFAKAQPARRATLHLFGKDRFQRWQLEQRFFVERLGDRGTICTLRFRSPEPACLRWIAGDWAEIRLGSPHHREIPAAIVARPNVIVAPHVTAALLPRDFVWRPVAPPAWPSPVRLPIASVATDGFLDLLLVQHPAAGRAADCQVTRHLLAGLEADIRLVPSTEPPPGRHHPLLLASDHHGLGLVRAVARERRGVRAPTDIATTVPRPLLLRILGDASDDIALHGMPTVALTPLARTLAEALTAGTTVIIAGSASDFVAPVEALVRATIGSIGFDRLIATRRWCRHPIHGASAIV